MHFLNYYNFDFRSTQHVIQEYLISENVIGGDSAFGDVQHTIFFFETSTK